MVLNTPVTIIQPSDGWRSLDLRELWDRRELLYFFAWRDLKVRYKQTLFGVLWAVAGPLASMVVFTFVFDKMAGLPSDGLPGPIFYLSGLVIWRYFANALSAASNSLVGNQTILTKVYFPRLIIPLSSCITGFADFFVALGVMLVLMAYYGILPGIAMLLLPFLLLLTMASALGAGLFFASLNVKYRDVGYILPFLLQLWMFCTIIVPYSEVAQRGGAWRFVYGLNPMGGVVEAFRWCLLRGAMTGPGNANATWILLGTGVPVALFILAAGLLYFKRLEKMFADIV
ncbi:MAG: ABC transporter permease [Candidatus Hydrogenedentes bacterium]|nr:ABC transporter permease [Candidatus Hydrogenedentota bacterium]